MNSRGIRLHSSEKWIDTVHTLDDEAFQISPLGMAIAFASIDTNQRGNVAEPLLQKASSSITALDARRPSNG